MITSSLSDSISFSDQTSQSIGQLITTGLSDTISFSDGVSNSLEQLIQAGLSDGLGFADKITTFPSILVSTFVLTIDPAYVVVTAPNSGGQAGCDAGGNVVNTISGASVTSCSGGTETITIPNPAAGTYSIEIFPVGGGGSFTITAQTFDSNGKQIADTEYAGSTSQGSQTVSGSLSAGGSVSFSSSFPTPELPFGTITAILAPLLSLVAIMAVRRRTRKKVLRLYHRSSEINSFEKTASTRNASAREFGELKSLDNRSTESV